jgi:hypothetical protein
VLNRDFPIDCNFCCSCGRDDLHELFRLVHNLVIFASHLYVAKEKMIET